MRSVVSGRVVNVYSTNDSILAFLYRSSSIQLGVAGLQAIKGVKGVENVDVSDLVSGHTRYRYITGSILKKIGFEDVDLEEVAEEEQQLKVAEEQEEEERKKKEGDRDVEDADQEAKRMEKEVQERNEQSSLSRATEKLGVSSAASREHKAVS